MAQLSPTKSPLEIGLARGSEGLGVEQLQTYLRQFGYLHLEDAGEFSAIRAASPLPRPTPGQFDAATVRALRAYQQFQGLPVTGRLDDATVAFMAIPRCGVPDVGDTAGISSFVAQGNRWPTNDIRYGFSNFTPDLTQQQVRTAISAAFSLWSAVTPLTFSEVPVAQNPEIVISFAAGSHGDGKPFAGAGGVLAHAFYPPPNKGSIAGDAHFDEAETWSVTIPVPAGRFDLVTIAAHEFGHALGLRHSDVPSALMRPTFTSGAAQRFLTQDDIDGIQSIYGTKTGGWKNLGGVLTSAPEVASWDWNHMDAFYRGQNMTVWHRSWDGNAWSGEQDLGGGLTSNPAAVCRAPNHIDLFYRGQNQALWHRWTAGGAWSDEEDMGGGLTSGPCAASWGVNRIDVFYRGQNQALWHRWWDGNAWSGEEDLGGVLTSDPAAVSWGANRIDVVYRGQNQALWHRWWDGFGWSGEEDLGGVLTSAPAAASWVLGKLDVYYRGQNQHLWRRRWSGVWSNEEDLGGTLTSDPAVVSRVFDRTDIFVRGTGSSLLHKWWDGAFWKP
ncbi:MAG TPA: matrixin family metalloprotease [Solirubrobacteraceae bacterium]|jgi:peptidoglycan hydrolase-like protein with peptidoglycan-binding domain